MRSAVAALLSDPTATSEACLLDFRGSQLTSSSLPVFGWLLQRMAAGACMQRTNITLISKACRFLKVSQASLQLIHSRHLSFSISAKGLARDVLHTHGSEEGRADALSKAMAQVHSSLQAAAEANAETAASLQRMQQETAASLRHMQQQQEADSNERSADLRRLDRDLQRLTAGAEKVRRSAASLNNHHKS